MPTNFWKARPRFIIGATGLMGTWLLRRLVDKGAEVVALVRDDAPLSIAVVNGLLTKLAIVHGSLEDFSLMRRGLCYLSPVVPGWQGGLALMEEPG
jgi:CDP-glucose 4,6-dehydratase